MKYLKKFNESVTTQVVRGDGWKTLYRKWLSTPFTVAKIQWKGVKVSQYDLLTMFKRELESRGEWDSEWTESHEIYSKSEKIDWNSIESQWDNWYESSNGEADYDDEYDAMKSFVKKVEVEWSEVEREYFVYIEETNNEEEYDAKFNKFKSLVEKNLK